MFKLLLRVMGSRKRIFKADEPQGVGINSGEDWRRRIVRELHNCSALVGIVTRTSLLERWLWLEAGVVWSQQVYASALSQHRPKELLLLVAPGISSSELSPFDVLQVVSLDSGSGQRVKDAVMRLGRALGVRSIKWGKEEEAQVQAILRHASASASTPARTKPAEDFRQQRDKETLERLLKHIPANVFDYFIDHARTDIIPGLIFGFWEDFDAEVRRSDFHVFDEELREKVQALHKPWGRSLNFTRHFQRISGNQYKYTSHVNGFITDEDGRAHAAYIQAVRDTAVAYKELISYVKQHYPEFDLREIGRQAMAQYRREQEEIQSIIRRSTAGTRFAKGRKKKRKTATPPVGGGSRKPV